MSEFKLIIGNKNYSSWSLRPWLVMKKMGLDFIEIRIPLYQSDSKQQILKHSPAGKVPILHHGEVTVWESLAICEYLAELERSILPEESIARAVARSVSSEMHGGFLNLRSSMPMNCRARLPGKGMNPQVAVDIARITAIWQDCRQQFGSGGDFLFGNFTIADAMFAPVVIRFVTYGVELDEVSRAYAEMIWQMPEMQAWIDAGSQEVESLPQFELEKFN